MHEILSSDLWYFRWIRWFSPMLGYSWEGFPLCTSRSVYSGTCHDQTDIRLWWMAWIKRTLSLRWKHPEMIRQISRRIPSIEGKHRPKHWPSSNIIVNSIIDVGHINSEHPFCSSKDLLSQCNRCYQDCHLLECWPPRAFIRREQKCHQMS